MNDCVFHINETGSLQVPFLMETFFKEHSLHTSLLEKQYIRHNFTVSFFLTYFKIFCVLLQMPRKTLSSLPIRFYIFRMPLGQLLMVSLPSDSLSEAT